MIQFQVLFQDHGAIINEIEIVRRHIVQCKVTHIQSYTKYMNWC